MEMQGLLSRLRGQVDFLLQQNEQRQLNMSSSSPDPFALTDWDDNPGNTDLSPANDVDRFPVRSARAGQPLEHRQIFVVPSAGDNNAGEVPFLTINQWGMYQAWRWMEIKTKWRRRRRQLHANAEEDDSQGNHGDEREVNGSPVEEERHRLPGTIDPPENGEQKENGDKVVTPDPVPTEGTDHLAVDERPPPVEGYTASVSPSPANTDNPDQVPWALEAELKSPSGRGGIFPCT